MVRVIWSKPATEDLRAIFEYHDHYSTHQAKLVLDRIMTASEQLEVFPRSGRMIAHFRRDNLREILVHRYRIIYYIRNDEEVEIIAVVHSSKQN